MAEVAAKRALACAGLTGRDIDLIVFGSTTTTINVRTWRPVCKLASALTVARRWTSTRPAPVFCTDCRRRRAMIRSGVVRSALVIGGERIAPYMDWNDRNVAVLFGDGAAAVVLQATERDEGVQLEKLGCYGDAREILRIHGIGGAYVHQGRLLGATEWQFEGQEIFKKAVNGMGSACEDVLRRAGIGPDDIDLVIPHQANLRIIEFVAKRAGVPMERVFVNVQRYGNMSAATVPVALCEALEQGLVKPGAKLLMPAFGGGLTFCAHLVRFGERVTPIATSDAELPPATRSALDMVLAWRAAKGAALA
jgi:3-oxoacyl-[acyl-carrier-protein] synthase-3